MMTASQREGCLAIATILKAPPAQVVFAILISEAGDTTVREFFFSSLFFTIYRSDRAVAVCYEQFDEIVGAMPLTEMLERAWALSRHTLRRRFLTACRALGLERLAYLTIHHGRHSFISHALAGGRTLSEVRDAAGHSNVSVTSAYLHVAVDGDEGTVRKRPF